MLPPSRWAEQHAHLLAVDLFNRRFYWEAHEAWESLWARARDPRQRDFLQGLIQLAAALLQQRARRRTGMLALRARACGKLEAALRGTRARRFMGLDVRALRRDVDAAFRAFDRGAGKPGRRWPALAHPVLLRLAPPRNSDPPRGGVGGRVARAERGAGAHVARRDVRAPGAEERAMAQSVRIVDYWVATIPDRPGRGAELLAAFRDAGQNLLAVHAFPAGRGRTQVDLVPESGRGFVAAARKAKLALRGRKRAFLVQGDDRVGALQGILARLREARLNVRAVTGLAAGRGRFAAILWVKPAEVARAARVLRARKR